MYRTHNCGELTKKDIGKNVMLSGWIKKIRNLGSLLFLDIRDYFGVTQLIFTKKLLNNGFFLGKEFLIKIEGKVVERVSKNYKIPTGEIEILVYKIKILNKSIEIPFSIENNTDGNEEIRMKYRYLDIRRNTIKNNLINRHKLVLEIRNFLSKKGYLEIETPVLVNYTPEGARNFLVPSRKNSGKFYSLHQSPQMFKQLLMIGGIDKYFQIVKCFRDEDSRSDRQIEFTQIDCEMAFVNVNDVLFFFERFIKHILKKIKKINYRQNFTRISYYDAIKIYGTDSPDIRFGMKFIVLNEIVKKNNINFLIEKELTIGIKIKKSDWNIYNTDKKIDIIFSKIKKSNFLWIQYLPNKTFLYSKNCFFNKKILKIFIKYFKSRPGDILVISYGKKINTRTLLSEIRLIIIKNYHFKKNYKKFNPVWITDFPLLSWEEKYKKFKSVHHPFTSPKKEDIHLLNNHPEKTRSNSYDLIINGTEIGSGSIRINNIKTQKKIFQYLGYSSKEIQYKFGFFIKAFEFGTPPHGGIAFGLDRLINILEEDNNIKNFIAFPKNNEGRDLMTNTPSSLVKNIL
ncbi:aspartate--tRNA ligase [Blattabacterium cuenoti]|uniref:aspartate--tRNA ligase n=1 Tax=Blattabacterium cuenoti TaxID=1653831 RepID=UPI00163B8875|nr:aspartate--tRNA ligase [Blattabacterium cuenoti]